MSRQRPVIILGAGGHAKVLIAALQESAEEIIGIVDVDEGKVGQFVLGVPILGTESVLAKYDINSIRLVNGIGSVGKSSIRETLFLTFKQKGYEFAQVVHPQAIISSEVSLGEGTQVMAGVVMQPGSEVGQNTIINTGARVDHDCVIGDHVHLAPGVIFSGGVEVGDRAHVGTGATCIQNVKLGEGCIVGAGTVIIKDVAPHAKVVGVPGRDISK